MRPSVKAAARRGAGSLSVRALLAAAALLGLLMPLVVTVLAELGLTLATFPDLGLDRHMNDRELWNYCQANDWVLFTHPALAPVLAQVTATSETIWDASLSFGPR